MKNCYWFEEEQEHEVESERILAEVFDLEEEAGKNLTKQLQIMSCNVSNIINLNRTQYSDEYALYSSLAQYKKLAELKAPEVISQEEGKEKRYFKDAKQPFLSSDSEKDDESSVASTRKRKREADLDELDIVQVVKELLNAVFDDTLLRWRSGERITAATKRMRKQDECTAVLTTTTIRNLMRRRNYLAAYN
ncbi:hypothetical protein EDC96DRAFT_582960 [Choanephora cucurbitarum]|nr:hypothetical protein EDC96DRAFT_582960 [Choanephora cucurbitarum]